MKRLTNILFSGDKNAGLIFLAVFLFESRWIIESAVLFITSKPVPLSLHIPIVISVYLLAVFPFVSYFKRTNDEYKFLKGLPGAFFGMLTIIFSVLVYGIMMNQWAKLIPLVRESGMMLHLAAGLFLIIMIFMAAVFVFVAGYFIVCIDYQAGWRSFGKAFTAYTRIVKDKSGHFFINLFFAVILIIIMLFADKLLRVIFNNMLPDIFVSRFMFGLFFSALGAYLFLILIRMTKNITEGREEELRENLGQGGIPYVLIGIFLFTIIVSAVSLNNVDDGIANYCNSVENTILKADLLYEEGKAYLAVPQYIKARSDLAVIKDFVLELMQKKGLSAEYMPLYIKGYEEISIYRDYFINMNSGDYGGTELNNEIYDFPEAALWNYVYYRSREDDDKEKAMQAFNRIVMQDVYVDQYSRSLNLSEKEVKNTLARIEELQRELDQRQLIYFLEKDQYESKSELLKEMIDFAENSSESPYLYRYIAEIAEQEGVNNSSREIIQKYAMKYYNSINYSEDKELEIDTSVFTAYKLNKSGSGNEAIKILEELHAKYPDEQRVLSAYSYVLLDNKNYEKSNQIAEKLNDTTPDKHYLMGVNFLEMGDVGKSIESMERLAGLMETDADEPLIQEVDQYLYRYVLEFITVLTGQSTDSSDMDFAEISTSMEREMEELDTDTLVYRYLSGVTNWYRQAYDDSNAHFEWILTKYPQLAYPNLMIGMNYYEKKEMEEKDYTKEAEGYLLTFVNQVPDAEEAFFALGPIYTYRSDSIRSNRAIHRMYMIYDEIGTWNDEWGLDYHAVEYLSEGGAE